MRIFKEKIITITTTTTTTTATSTAHTVRESLDFDAKILDFHAIFL